MTRNCNELEGNTERKKSSLPSETPFSNILTPLSDEDKKNLKHCCVESIVLMEVLSLYYPPPSDRTSQRTMLSEQL